MPQKEEAQLREMGATDEYIEQKREYMLRQAEENVVEITLWPDIEDPFQVFRFSKWSVVAGFGGAFYDGIPGSEIRSVAGMLEIETDVQLLNDIRVMENAARSILNAKK